MDIHEVTATITTLDEELELQYVGTEIPYIPQPAGEQSCRITITEAIDALEESIEAKEMSLKYLHEQDDYSTASADPIVIADIITGDDAHNGRENEQWRAVQVTSHQTKSPSYSVGIPQSAITHLEREDKGVSGNRIDIWISKNNTHIGFTPAATTEIQTGN